VQQVETPNSQLGANTYPNHRIPRWLLVIIVSIFPAVATLLLFSWQRADMNQFLPLVWNDQTWMWHQVSTYSQVGFDGGYYAPNELPAAASFSHFSSWGPIYPMMLGTIARLTGWEPYTGILFNLFLLTGTIWLFLTLIPFDRTQILLTGLILLTLTPVLMYLPTISQETFHQSAAVLVAGIFYLLLIQQNPPRYLRWSALLILIFLSIIRFSWAIFFFPLFLIGATQPGKRGLASALLKAGLIAIPLYLFIGYISSPGGSFLYTMLSAINTAPLKVIGNLIQWMAGNFIGFLFPFAEQNALTPDFVQAIQFMLLLGTLIVFWIQQRRVPHKTSATSFGADMFFHLYNLTIILFLALLFYLWYGYYRIFGVHLLVTLLLLVGFKRYRLVVTFIIIGLIGLPVFFNNYQSLHAGSFHQTGDDLQVDGVRVTLEQYIVYKPDAPNPWCNTVLFPNKVMDYHILTIPPKIGISFLWFGDVDFPLKSRYLLFDDETYQTMHDRLHVETLVTVPGATLYRNLDLSCSS
jgi:hypothetical protein